MRRVYDSFRRAEQIDLPRCNRRAIAIPSVHVIHTVKLQRQLFARFQNREMDLKYRALFRGTIAGRRLGAVMTDTKARELGNCIVRNRWH
jgi:hypothetical protein